MKSNDLVKKIQEFKASIKSDAAQLKSQDEVGKVEDVLNSDELEEISGGGSQVTDPDNTCTGTNCGINL